MGGMAAESGEASRGSSDFSFHLFFLPRFSSVIWHLDRVVNS
jgi:hypothetical protein